MCIYVYVQPMKQTNFVAYQNSFRMVQYYAQVIWH